MTMVTIVQAINQQQQQQQQNALASNSNAFVILIFYFLTRPGDPVIQCGTDYVAFHFRTRQAFTGKAFVKGHYLSPECQIGWNSTQSATGQSSDGGTIWIKHGRCGMHRLRTTNPHGVQFSTVIVVSFHPVFITKMDRAYNVKCEYLETQKSITYDLNVSPITVTQIAQSFPEPSCSYTIRKDELDGEVLKYARVGQQVVHRWECETSVYGMLVHSCFVEDGQGRRVMVIDEQGCHTDRLLLGDPTYVEALNVAYRESSVFKFADRIAVRFICQIRLCLRTNEGCAGITPPACPSPMQDTSERINLRREKRAATNDMIADLVSQTVYVLDDTELNDYTQLEEPSFEENHKQSSTVCISPIAVGILGSCLTITVLITSMLMIVFGIRRRSGAHSTATVVPTLSSHISKKYYY
ncbi:Cuticlin-1 [Trichinella pseudospiralis]|uniref:Cuticlin-1 n=1 Tax=Trichinella pseudospiralis TaxID=6337 RepID=A0A0V0Y812_TRIPS|nr:Cuticlin-1 [Trichinella pseudospiralis]